MRILLVEDDKILCSTVAMQLEQAGYQVDQCYRGDDALYYATEYPYDVLILDRMLPSLDGLSLLQAIRQKSVMTPVIITTALDGVGDRIDGLDAGADTANLTFGSLCLDTVKHELTREGASSETVTLSGRESSLLEYLMRNAGRTLPRNAILSYVWGPDSEVEAGNLDNYIYFLRRRLKALHGNAKIQTVHGVGYRLEEFHD